MVRAAALIALAMLAGCSRENDEVCSPYPPRIVYLAPLTEDQISANANSCVLHWSARLSLSKERPDLVARAAMGACREGLNDYASMVEADAFNRWSKALEEQALFRVIQRRAGNCELPDLGDPINKNAIIAK